MQRLTTYADIAREYGNLDPAERSATYVAMNCNHSLTSAQVLNLAQVVTDTAVAHGLLCSVIEGPKAVYFIVLNGTASQVAQFAAAMAQRFEDAGAR